MKCWDCAHLGRCQHASKRVKSCKYFKDYTYAERFVTNKEVNWFEWTKDNVTPKVHPTQKPVPLLKRLIEIFTDEGDVVIDPVAGSGTTLRAAAETNRSAYGFEIKKDFYKAAKESVLTNFQTSLFYMGLDLFSGEAGNEKPETDRR